MAAILNYVAPKEGLNPLMTGFIGDACGLRFYVTPNAPTTAGTLVTYVYQTIILGRGAFGIGGLAANVPGAVSEARNDNNTFKKVRPIRLITKGFESGGTADPLEQRATIGWWSTFVVKRLIETFMMRIEHATTLGSSGTPS